MDKTSVILLFLWWTSPCICTVLDLGSRLPSIYEVALNELQELETEPLCHRIAARLLVNNCHLLDGKDEASALTDSGRQARDFVDSYAASLAICDLERGKFVIPAECSQFREPVLSQMPVRTEPYLHVGSRQIEDCLTGLAASDSAWNTWISYRHKAVRFCEAARADNEKTQNILFYQRLTKVIAKLADGVEIELQKRMESLDLQARQANAAMDALSPQIDRLKDDLSGIQSYLSQDIKEALRRSTGSINEGLENAANLQHVLAVLTKTVLDSNSRVASAHEQSLELVNQRTADEMTVFIAAMTAAVASSASLQNDIELARLQSAELANRQGKLEDGMHRLIGITETLSSRYDNHNHLLSEAHNITNELLDTLEMTATTAASFQGSIFEKYGGSSWWPYIFCPAAFLLMGSYGLPPSALRNFGLIALGGLFTMFLSLYQQANVEFLNFEAAGSRVPGNVSTGDI